MSRSQLRSQNGWRKFDLWAVIIMLILVIILIIPWITDSWQQASCCKDADSLTDSKQHQ